MEVNVSTRCFTRVHQDVLGSCTNEQAGEEEKVLKNHHFGGRGKTPCEAGRRFAVDCEAARFFRDLFYWTIMNEYKFMIDTTSR